MGSQMGVYSFNLFGYMVLKAKVKLVKNKIAATQITMMIWTL